MPYDYKKTSEKVKPLVNHILRKCEAEGFTYRETIAVGEWLCSAAKRQTEDLVDLPFVIKDIQ